MKSIITKWDVIDIQENVGKNKHTIYTCVSNNCPNIEIKIVKRCGYLLDIINVKEIQETKNNKDYLYISDLAVDEIYIHATLDDKCFYVEDKGLYKEYFKEKHFGYVIVHYDNTSYFCGTKTLCKKVLTKDKLNKDEYEIWTIEQYRKHINKIEKEYV
jgi:hypothetical protein